MSGKSGSGEGSKKSGDSKVDSDSPDMSCPIIGIKAKVTVGKKVEGGKVAIFVEDERARAKNASGYELIVADSCLKLNEPKSDIHSAASMTEFEESKAGKTVKPKRRPPRPPGVPQLGVIRQKYRRSMLAAMVIGGVAIGSIVGFIIVYTSW